MDRIAEVYRLSFVPPERGDKVGPQIAITCKAALYERLNDLLKAEIADTHRVSMAYVAKPTKRKRSASAITRFGFGQCGFVSFDGDEVTFHVKLSPAHATAGARTINALLRAFVTCGHERTSNRMQQITLETLCQPYRQGGYGHMVGGYIAPELLSWLRRQGAEGAPAIPHIEASLRIAWRAVAPRDLKLYAKNGRVRIEETGAFSLHCFGDACDVSLYYDQLHGVGDDEPVRFGCHNLDTAVQQLTLMAGLAKMCELARSAEN